MRKEFIAKVTRKKAVSAMTWASKIVKMDGGYMGFESLDDYKTFSNQK